MDKVVNDYLDYLTHIVNEHKDWSELDGFLMDIGMKYNIPKKDLENILEDLNKNNYKVILDNK